MSDATTSNIDTKPLKDSRINIKFQKLNQIMMVMVMIMIMIMIMMMIIMIIIIKFIHFFIWGSPLDIKLLFISKDIWFFKKLSSLLIWPILWYLVPGYEECD
jgi:hypothetical protein